MISVLFNRFCQSVRRHNNNGIVSQDHEQFCLEKKIGIYTRPEKISSFPKFRVANISYFVVVIVILKKKESFQCV